MEPIVSGNLEVVLVLIAYAASCLVVMGVLFRNEWKKQTTPKEGEQK